MYSTEVLEESGHVDEDILGKVDSWRGRLTENEMSLVFKLLRHIRGASNSLVRVNPSLG